MLLGACTMGSSAYAPPTSSTTTTTAAPTATAGTAAPSSNSGSSSSANCSGSSCPASDWLACAAIWNQVDGAYANSDAATKQSAGQEMLQRAEAADNPALGNEAQQLQADANAANQTAVNADLGNMGQTCTNMGLTPNSGSAP